MADNLFDKIDQQGETIDQVADKLKDVSVEDLYALAKRTWDFKDYEMAQKYYNHIALLRPLEWEAPLYASLCGILVPAPVFEWEHRPTYLVRYATSTIDYIQNTAMEADKKGAATLKALDIIISVLKEIIRIYCIPENRESFDENAPIFKSNLVKAFSEIVKHIEGFNAQDILSKKEELCKICGEFIRDFCNGEALPISKDEYNRLFLPFANVEFPIKVECVKLEKCEHPSAEYLTQATVYCYEPNTRKLNKYKKKRIAFASIWLAIELALLAACIYLIAKAQYVIPLVLTSICVGAIYNTSSIIYYRFYKNKMRAYSLFNQENTSFCIDKETNTFEKETKKGVAFYFCILAIAFGFIAILVDTLVINKAAGGGLFIGLVSFILHISGYLPIAISNQYHYTQFIFDTPSSYMIYDGRNWQKADKNNKDAE